MTDEKPLNLSLSPAEYRVMMKALKRFRVEVRGKIARNERDGWRPEPGRADTWKYRMSVVDALLARYDGLPV